MWGIPGSLKTQEFLGGLGQGKGGQMDGTFPVPRRPYLATSLALSHQARLSGI